MEYDSFPNATNHILISLGWRLKFPVRLIGKGLFRIGKAECGYGFVPYIRFALVIVKLGEQTTDFDDYTIGTVTLYEGTTNIGTSFGAGLEWRWKSFGLHMEVSLDNLGELAPAPGLDPAEAMGAFVVHLGFSFYI